MSEPGEKLASSLEYLHNLQDNKGLVAIKSSEISRTHRERLKGNGFLKEVTKGWYIAADPQENIGDSTSWYSSFWKFCAQYLQSKYENDYCISPEHSIQIHAGNTALPDQLIIRSPRASNSRIDFLYNTSIFAMRSNKIKPVNIIEKNGLKIYSLLPALILSSPTMFKKYPTDMRIALAQIKDSSEILNLLLEGSHTVIAGRLAGAFRNINNTHIADNIIKTMKSAGHTIREVDPFIEKTSTNISFGMRSPYSNRLKLIWSQFRDVVIEHFPESPGLPKDRNQYLDSIDKIYLTDAYHSLSIEKYIVSKDLIEKVRSGNWDIENNPKDRNQRDVMAARGYWQATQSVKNSIAKILTGINAGVVANDEHVDWYRELFAPSVQAGILKPSDLAGYRTGQVYISQSRHIPPNKEAVRDSMPILFELLENEKDPGVKAILGHFIFVYIHPYMDGNGRIARFLMNVMLASGGYPWTVIPVQNRNIYMDSLEEASVNKNIEPFVLFISKLVKDSLKGIQL